jgi:outer membrane receptor protein involved in Fe transport
MKINAPRLRLNPLASAIAFVLTASSSPLFVRHALAQESVEEITVTGSRIQRDTSFTTAVPVTAVTPADLASFRPGATMADQLDQLPQFYQTQSAQRGSGALFGGAGRSVIDLRAMGPQRTLVLLDGARLAPADRDGSVHIDNIPTALLSQVEVVTGGASAAYGADALAGVTNFRLNRQYDGLNLSLGIGALEGGGGDDENLSVAYGTDIGDRWHFIGSLESQRIDEITYDPLDLDPDWFRRWGIVANPAWTAGNTSVPMRLALPDVYSRNHTPAGKIGTTRNAAGAPAAFTLAGQTFTDNGAAVRPFETIGAISGGAATGNQSGGTAVVNGMTEAERANRAFNGGQYGADVQRDNVFAGFTFDVNDSTRFFSNLLAGSTESNDLDERGIPHMASPWTTQIFADNAYLPASVRNAMIAQGVDSFVMEKQGQFLNQPGGYDDHEKRHNQYDSWTLQLGLDKDVGDNWKMQARVQRGATRRFTKIFNEVRVDREMLAVDAVEVYGDRRDANADGVIDLVANADRGTGQIICNVQRYNPTPAQLQASVANVRVPAAQGDDSLGNGDPLFGVPIPSPVGPDAIPNCVPMNIFGQGNVSAVAADYVVSPKWGDSVVTQEFAEVLFTGDIWKGYGPGAFALAVGATYRDQWFWQRGQPQALMAYGPPRNADGSASANGVNVGIRGIQGGFTTGSPNLHEFSTVPTINGGYDVWEMFSELNMPLYASEDGKRRLEFNVAGRYSDYSTSGGISSYKAGINFQAFEFLRFRSTFSRDVREPTFAERFDVQGGGGMITENVLNGVPNPGGAGTPTVFQITSTALGNQSLEPEEADTVTAGIVVQPADTGLQLSIDWYDIDLAGAIGQLGVQGVLNECTASGGTGPLCQYVFRDPITNAVTAVRNPWLNINNAAVRGIDYELLWNRETHWFSSKTESLTLRFLAGRLLEDSTTTPTGAITNLAGELGEPDFRGLIGAKYQVGKFGVSLQERYLSESGINAQPGPVTFVQFEPGRVPGPGQLTLDDATVDSKAYTDLTLTYDHEMSTGKTWQLSLAITNLLDENPPIIPVFDQRFSAQSNPAGFNAYDVYGRRYLLSFNYRL